MEIGISLEGPVHIMKLTGELDADNYLHLIDQAGQLYADEGTYYLLLDLTDLKFMSSSGLVALHSIILLFRGQTPLSTGDGWTTMHAMADDVEAATGMEAHVKLYNPQPAVTRTLEIAGFNRLLEIHTDWAAALASFTA